MSVTYSLFFFILFFPYSLSIFVKTSSPKLHFHCDFTFVISVFFLNTLLLFRVNDRIISVNGISLQNVDYATAVQVLRDSGDTVVLVVKRRNSQHQHSHSLSASFTGPPLAALGINPLPPKVTLTKGSKKEGEYHFWTLIVCIRAVLRGGSTVY